MGVNPGFLVLAFSIRTLQSSGVPARRVQARGFCVGMLPLVCSTPACRRAFSCGPSLLRFGVRLSSQDLLVVKLSPLCWLPAVPGERRGFLSRGLLAASGSCKTSCSSCFADASERGVNPRLEVGGSACVAPALRSRGCGCFCLRLDFQVAVSVRGSQGTWVLSACL